MRLIIALIAIWVTVSAGVLTAQDFSAAKKKKCPEFCFSGAWPRPSGNRSARNCPLPSQAEQTLPDALNGALQCEWIIATQNTLEALHLLTIPDPADNAVLDTSQAGEQRTKAVRHALCRLIQGDPDDSDTFCAAMGNPDDCGRPTATALSSFVDALATANRFRDSKKALNEDELFGKTKKLIDDIFCDKAHGGQQALNEVNDYFTQKHKYVAFVLLLDAYGRFCARGETCPADLELLRAALGTSPDRLAAQVAEKFSKKLAGQ